MSITITSLLARRFALGFTAGGTIETIAASTPRTLTLAAATYAMHAGPTSGTGRDFLYYLQGVINAALITDGVTCTCGLNATGKVAFTFSAAVKTTFSTDLLALLGIASNVVSGVALTGTTQPQQVFFSGSRPASLWRMGRVVAADVTAGGVAYGIDSGLVRDEREQVFAKIPRDPTVRAALGQNVTALHPADTLLATRGGHAGEWSLDDVLATAAGATFALYEGNLQESLTDSAERYSLVAIDPQDAMSPRCELDADGYEAWHRCTLRLIRSGTGTRA